MIINYLKNNPNIKVSENKMNNKDIIQIVVMVIQ